VRILLLSAYDAQSHKYWRQSLVAQLAHHDWTELVLPGRHFSWRIRGNSMQWALGERAVLEQPYELIIATSMVDLASLKGMVPHLANIPCLMYFHENQFVYPSNHANRVNQSHNLDPKMVTLYGALAADRLLFNSQYNRHSFLLGVAELLQQLPDKMPVDVPQLLLNKSQVLAVPLTALAGQELGASLWPQHSKQQPLRLVWAARWEYDKGPLQLLAILHELKARKVHFNICILGQKFRNSPQEFEQIQTQFSQQIVHSGFAESRQQYLTWLAGADMVLSTALHEFQGLAVLEAVQLGCIPILPKRLVYAELFADDYLYPSDADDIQLEAKAAVDLIQQQASLLESNKHTIPKLEHLEWPVMAAQYEQSMALAID